MTYTAAEIRIRRTEKNLTQEDFADKIGVSPRTIQYWEEGRKIPGSKMRVLERFFESNDTENVIVNKNGNKFTETADGQKIIEVSILPFEAYAKYLEEGDEAGFFEEYEKITFAVDKLGKGNYLGFRISGDSMDGGKINDTPNRAIVLGRELQRVHWVDGFNEAKHGWIILTNKNILFKDIIGFDREKGIITCHSRNDSPEYCDFPLSLNDVNKIFKVIKRTF